MLRVTLGVALFASVASLAGADGKEAFVDNSCDRCHAVASQEIEATVKSERMRGPDLSEIGNERDAEWISGYLSKELDLDGKPHRSMFRGSEDDLDAIAEWLATLTGGE